MSESNPPAPLPDPRRGEVWFVDLGKPRGHEQALRRPVIVLQSNRHSMLPVRVVMPVTSKKIEGAVRAATGYFLRNGTGGLTVDSVALLAHVRALDLRYFETKLGTLPDEALAALLDSFADFLDYDAA